MMDVVFVSVMCVCEIDVDGCCGGDDGGGV